MAEALTDISDISQDDYYCFFFRNVAGPHRKRGGRISFSEQAFAMDANGERRYLSTSYCTSAAS
jgi:hypothetical protein